MSKLVDNACLWRKKLNFHFLISLFSSIALPMFTANLSIRVSQKPLAAAIETGPFVKKWKCTVNGIYFVRFLCKKFHCDSGVVLLLLFCLLWTYFRSFSYLSGYNSPFCAERPLSLCFAMEMYHIQCHNVSQRSKIPTMSLWNRRNLFFLFFLVLWTETGKVFFRLFSRSW